jgi:hypothetical protein
MEMPLHPEWPHSTTLSGAVCFISRIVAKPNASRESSYRRVLIYVLQDIVATAERRFVRPTLFYARVKLFASQSEPLATTATLVHTLVAAAKAALVAADACT